MLPSSSRTLPVLLGILLLAGESTVVVAGPVAAGICYSGCATLVVACYGQFHSPYKLYIVYLVVIYTCLYICILEYFYVP